MEQERNNTPDSEEQPVASTSGVKRAGDDLDPFEINFLPEFQQGRGPHQPFVNEFGVVIGDHDYESPNSPLNQWTTDTDPEMMAGDRWVHPYKDIGFHSAENRDYFEKKVAPQSGIYMHPDKNTSYKAFHDNPNAESGPDTPAENPDE